MVRKQIYISERQKALLKRLAEQRGVSQAEVVRQAIDHEFARAEAWEEAKRFMRSLDERTGEFKEPLRWRREDAYEERLSRYDR